MNGLSGEQLLELWDRGARRHVLDRGLVLLSIARPGDAMDDLADVPVGERDQALFALRCATFGKHLPSFVDCPACATRLEFTLDCGDLRGDPAPRSIEVNGRRVRPPTSRDLAAALSEPNDASAERHLIQRCLIGSNISEVELSPSEIATVQGAMTAADTAGDIELDFACVSCGHSWHSAFDIVDYLWREIEVRARSLLHDIHLLARAYGWTEHDVLALSDDRRRAYVEMVAP